MLALRKDAVKGHTSPVRVRAAEVAAGQLREAEAHRKELEQALAGYRRELREAEAEHAAIPYATRIPWPFWPSQEAAAIRSSKGPRLESELARVVERIGILTERVRDLTALAQPLSEAATRRLQQLVADADADAELERVGIRPDLLTRTPEGRAHLREVAKDYGL